MCRWTRLGGLLLGVLMAVAGGLALTNVSVNVPLAVKIMDTVTLQCKYDLQGEPLYTVKWYKGSKEFYRYIPKELPNTVVFPLPGVNVDLSKSSPNEVVLRNVQPEVTGRYKCEVSSDAPNFYTYIVSGYMYVIDVPEEDPQVQFDRELLVMGDTVRGNCTSPPTYPPMNITWFLNGKKINASNVKTVLEPNAIVADNRRQPAKTVSEIEIDIDLSTFESGKAAIQCVASLFHLYRKEIEKVLEEDRPNPKPSSELRARDASGGRSFNQMGPLLSLVVVAVGLR